MRAVTAGCFVAMAWLVTLAVAYNAGEANAEPEIIRTTESYRQGEAPESEPVLVFWQDERGILRGQSAMRIGKRTLPWSATGWPVLAEDIDYQWWTFVHPILTGGTP